MKYSDLSSASQYTEIRKVDFIYQYNGGTVSEKLLPLIEAGTEVSCSEKTAAAIIARYTKGLRKSIAFCKFAFVFCICLLIIALVGLVYTFIREQPQNILNISPALTFIVVPTLLGLLFIKLIRDANATLQQMCSKSNPPTITVRTYPIRDTYVYHDMDNDAEYYIMLDGFAICTGKEPNKFAKSGLSISAAVIEIQNKKYFTILD